jgi:hypothetical protein
MMNKVQQDCRRMVVALLSRKITLKTVRNKIYLIFARFNKMSVCISIQFFFTYIYLLQEAETGIMFFGAHGGPTMVLIFIEFFLQ